MTIQSLLVSLIVSFAVAEVVGYFLHRLLHSGFVPGLSRAHMRHHLEDYGPDGKLRLHRYLPGGRGRTNFMGTGLEWLVPLAIIVALLVGIMYLLGVPALYQVVVVVGSILWGWVMLDVMHGSMHKRAFWMLRIPILRGWFRRARRLHDIHHLVISDDGRMRSNFGICFFLLDRVFGTFRARGERLNKEGLRLAVARFRPKR